MTDVEIQQFWRTYLNRQAVGHPSYKSFGRFFERFDRNFKEVMSDQKVTFEALRVMHADMDDKGLYGPGNTYNDLLCRFREGLERALWGHLPNFPEKEFRPGSGQTIKPGSNQDVTRIRQPTRGRW